MTDVEQLSFMWFNVPLDTILVISKTVKHILNIDRLVEHQ